MNKLKVNIIADSISEEGIRLVTLHARYPRIIHGEVMTHRVFSRNARSSRAVPVNTMLQEVRNDPFIPWHWGKNQKGMQASEECNEYIRLPVFSSNAQNPYEYDGYDIWSRDTMEFEREYAWNKACDSAIEVAEALMNAGYHKQIANRLLEPFSYIDTLITSTSWANFFHLRDHEDAEPHFHDLASLIKEKINESIPKLLKNGEWHLPFFDKERDNQAIGDFLRDGSRRVILNDEMIEAQRKVSVARCARISYAPFDGNASIEKEMQRYDLLVGSESLHASPTEHQATPDRRYRGEYDWNNLNLHGNFEGWIQYRKTLKGEYVAD